MNATCLVDPYTLICNEYVIASLLMLKTDCLSGNTAVAVSEDRVSVVLVLLKI